MRKSILTLLSMVFLMVPDLIAQQYTAAGYWNMENDPVYTRLKQQQLSGDTLTVQEQSFMIDFKTKLDAYFEKLSDEEKSVYYKYRSKWAENPVLPVAPEDMRQDQDVFSGEKSAYTQYLISSGVFGYIYGLTTIGITETESAGAIAGIPLLFAGASTLIPVITLKDKKVTYNSLKLSIHGKALGYAHGAALSLLILGDNIEDAKLTLVLAGISSIGLGRLGYTFGRDKPWSQGRVALYSHYGILMPFEGLAFIAAFNSEEPRLYAASVLAFGASGYLIANKVADWNDFTKGDIISTQTLTTLNALLGLGIVVDINQDMESEDFSGSDFLFPAIGALGGTIAGHYWLKDARFTRQQGRNTALATAGASTIGLGLTALISPEAPTLYYVLPYISGITTFALVVNRYKNDNSRFVFNDNKASRWNVNLMPYTIFLNKKISAYQLANPSKRAYMMPAFSATYSF